LRDLLALARLRASSAPRATDSALAAARFFDFCRST
jgi:hypothetical protein